MSLFIEQYPYKNKVVIDSNGSGFSISAPKSGILSGNWFSPNLPTQSGQIANKAYVDSISGAQSAVFNSYFSGSNLIFVSKASGATDTRTNLHKYDPNRPFSTLTAAKNSAVSGDTIKVLPGTYNEYNLLKDEVNWYFENGAIINAVGNILTGIWDDNQIKCASEIKGYGKFITTNTGVSQGNGSLINLFNSSSNLNLTCTLISGLNGIQGFSNDKLSLINQSNGSLYLTCDEIRNTCNRSNSSLGLFYWKDGSSNINAKKMILDGTGNGTNSLENVYVGAATLNKDDLYINCDLMSNGCINGICFALNGDNSRRVWANVKEILASGSNSIGVWQQAYASNIRFYLNSQKIGATKYGILLGGGDSWINVQKITSPTSLFVSNSTNTSNLWLDCLNFEDVDGIGIWVTGPPSNLIISNLNTSYSNSWPVYFNSDGNITLKNCILKTAGNGNYPIVSETTTGTLILQNCTLISDSDQYSIFSNDSSIQNVKIYNCQANNDTDPNINIIGGILNVSSDIS